MRSAAEAPFDLNETGFGVHAFIRRLVERAVGLALFGGVALSVASLATWNVDDPSFSNATDHALSNAMGYPGAVISDLLMQFFGLSALMALVPAVVWAFLLATGRGIDRKPRRAGAWLLGALLAAGVAGCIAAPPTWPLPTGLGGAFGDLVLNLPALFIGGYPKGVAATIIGAVLIGPAVFFLTYGAGLIGRDVAPAKPARQRKRAARTPVIEVDDLEEEDDEDEDDGVPALGAVFHWWLSLRAFFHRMRMRGGRAGGIEPAMRSLPRETGVPVVDPDPRPGTARGVRVEPEFSSLGGTPDDIELADFDIDDEEDTLSADRPAVQATRSGGPAGATGPRIDNPAARPVPGARVMREAQTSLLSSDTFEMPSLHFLAEARSVARDPSLSPDALQQNARLLEGVLEDFGVKGEIIHVRPGPVVTLYELEPAPGIKSSRVIGLADDIARSMSAIACRVAVVPGRNAIGIELPNAKRETVYLREILASRDFEQSKAKLALALGKTINGEAVIADIAKFPHLLVAGTTGSGKSVAINTMILSILYRMTPADCRLIMIDPKMLELSIYDGIPHLLTPVVTDPKKAVVALKWTVREMEDRYRKMSKVGVRNIEGFNQRVAAAQKKGENIVRTVQTGFDRQTGEAIYETEELDLEPMPFIVVIIDEMADLMMVAGKDIEGAVQRLAQMARAAGIHVIMATQRPSVDVITGTIKANFPTRISFQVTSKIDSRTILGEQGAEQLLGMGDMLYMAGGGRIQRVHGPFVSDDEVEKVVSHLKLQGAPEYLEAITADDDEDDADGDGPAGGGGGNFDDSDDPYDQAVAVVLRDGKASTSYIQRRLGIGYNRAASIIEKMEKEGIVGPANHAGKREILVPTEEDVL
ncbi:FtsK/SpoIIIE family DNA translocase [Mesorhizobium koreense]|uniref:FtsK/SpoIIIE family DNA translocase n=1 Tax=Mesorhizobium koreense TaxID=3074855 RepID=UPI00287B77B1|nr:DNA translocase FtsK [Mesorhizobium sp. WR6]